MLLAILDTERAAFDRAVRARDVARKLAGDLAVGLDAHVGKASFAEAWAIWSATSDEADRLQRLVNQAHREYELAQKKRAGL